MSNPTGKRLLELFTAGGCPIPAPPATTEGKIRLPVPVVDNPRQDVPVPEDMRHLPIEERGYRVPYFVAWVDGKPDFRIVRPDAVSRCVRQGLCWLCGKPHQREVDGSYAQTYVIGPMCTINHISVEPGSHLECARYAARVCPFLSAPHMRRNEKDKPDDAVDPGGLYIKRNPGVSLLWTTKDFQLVPAGRSVLFRVGEPSHLEVWREGRYATHAEVMESIRTGLPILQAEADQQGTLAQHALVKMTRDALNLIERFV